jgi:hypothetical protein
MPLHLTPLPSGAAAGPTRALDREPAPGPEARACREVGLPPPVRELARRDRFAAPRRLGAALAVRANEPAPALPAAAGAACGDPCDALPEAHEGQRGRREGWWSA